MSTTYKKPTHPAPVRTCGEVFPTQISANFRIPSLVRLNDGTLVAAADARWDHEMDGGGLSLIVSRSQDGIHWDCTWPFYLGDGQQHWNPNASTLMDPMLITDGTALYLIADLFPAGYSISSVSTTHTFAESGTGFDSQGHLLLRHDNRHQYDYYLHKESIYHKNGSCLDAFRVDACFNVYQNGEYISNLFYADSPFKVPAVSYICIMQSTDGGRTWSSPSLINIKPKDAPWLVVGPDSGLITKNGRLAFTAYDGDHLYLVYYQDGWHTVCSNAASNESSLIELDDGTLRAFVKRSGANTIAYVDFIPCKDHYHPSELVDTKIPNFSNCMISSLRIHDRVYVGCPSASEGGTWGGRFRGTVYIFTLANDNSMSLLHRYPVNDGFFAYSSMAELPDGSIAMLYEDDCIQYPAGSYYGKTSHIQYTTLSLPR